MRGGCRGRLFASCLLGLIAAGGAAHAKPEQYWLTNGLRVVLDQDTRTPLVAVSLCVHAGGNDRLRNLSGVAHLFEHLLTRDSAHITKQAQAQILGEIGATTDAITYPDYTLYYATAPANALETLLWWRSDQFGFVADAVTGEGLAAEKQVVLNERRSRIDNLPDGRGLVALVRALAPPPHPLSEGVLGAPEDIQRITIEDVRAYAERYYRPGDSSLFIVGSFDPAQARAFVERYFGTLSLSDSTRYAPSRERKPILAPAAERRLAFEDHVSDPELIVAWLTPPAYAAEEYPMRLLASALSSSAHTGLLHRQLVTERHVATSASCSYIAMGSGSLLQCQLVPAKNVTLAQLEAEFTRTVEELSDHGLSSDDLARAKSRLKLEMIQDVEQLSNRANRLADYVHFTGDPDYFSRDIHALEAVPSAALPDGARRWLSSKRRVTITLTPEQR
jgi:zinc protease